MTEVLLMACTAAGADVQMMADTQPLTAEGDLAAEMVAGIDRHLLRELDRSPADREEPTRDRLRQIIGAVDPRPPVTELEFVSTTASPSLLGKGDGYEIHAVRWPALEGVHGEGLLLEPAGKPTACVVALPDADQTPEQLIGLTPGIPPEAQYARRLAECGCRVLVPVLIDRADTWSGHPAVRFTNQPHREWIYRAAYEMGRHVIGYEVQKVLAAVDWFTHQAVNGDVAIGVIGWGEGGLLALHSAAIDTRIDAVVVSGYFGPRENVWREPIYRNVWSLLRAFGDAELLSMVAPRMVIVEASRHPDVKGPPPERDGRRGAAPGVIETPSIEKVRAEFERAHQLSGQLAANLHLVETKGGKGLPGSMPALTRFLESLGAAAKHEKHRAAGFSPRGSAPPNDRPTARMKRQLDELNEFTQRLVRQSPKVRQAFWSKADSSSLQRWTKTTQSYRDYLNGEVFGALPAPVAEVNPRTIIAYQEPGWRGFKVMLDVLPDVFAYGILLVPLDIKPGERRPAVVCQHGLEGRASDTITGKGQAYRYYQSFARKLVERGFVVYSPQNPYIGRDAFRTLQRKANPLELSLFSFIVRQHEQTLRWLRSLPFVDGERIGFYGLSYGGKTAVRVPPLLVDGYALSICSADFNEWIWKITSIEDRYSYMFYGEYEITEFDLGNRFNYAELTSLMVPRPFMVERGHGDVVAPDEWVAYEYAKVRRLYDKLGIGDLTEIEFFDGPHQIHGVGTFAFLHKHLGWPEPGVTGKRATGETATERNQEK